MNFILFNPAFVFDVCYALPAWYFASNDSEFVELF